MSFNENVLEALEEADRDRSQLLSILNACPEFPAAWASKAVVDEYMRRMRKWMVDAGNLAHDPALHAGEGNKARAALRKARGGA